MKRTVEDLRGPPIVIEELEITPVARATGLRLGSWLQIYSVRPAAVVIRESDGATRRLSIPDMRRWIRLGELLLVLAVMMVRKKND